MVNKKTWTFLVKFVSFHKNESDTISIFFIKYSVKLFLIKTAKLIGVQNCKLQITEYRG